MAAEREPLDCTIRIVPPFSVTRKRPPGKKARPHGFTNPDATEVICSGPDEDGGGGGGGGGAGAGGGGAGGGGGGGGAGVAA